MTLNMMNDIYGIDGSFMSRPFRAYTKNSISQGVALGWYITPF
jgi:hypothetical protein